MRLACWLCLAAACGGPPGGGDAGASLCPNLSPACPATPPSYSAQVAPILERACLPCHTLGRSGCTGPNLSTWAAASGLHTTILNDLYICKMPNVDAGPGCVPDGGAPTLSDTDRLTVMEWCLCGAPDN